MNLYELKANPTGLSLSQRIDPMRFKSVNGNSKEQDLEDLIIRHPGLLNLGDYTPKADEPDLLIISRQPKTSTSKRADLFAIDREGTLVIIEVKRDAEDERNRKEAMEFQAIRYAAASRKLTVERIIQMFGKFLASTAPKLEVVAGSKPAADEEDYESKAELLLRNHLADEEETLTLEDLQARINPKAKQRIYLVAASYEPDVTSACAWLREHDIPIFCFQLRPYRIGNVEVLDRHRLIPPPELDEYLLDMASPGGDSRTAGSEPRGPRTASDKPVSVSFLSAGSEPTTYSVNSWKVALLSGIRHLLETEKLPEKKLAVPTNKSSSVPLRNGEVVTGELEIETNASARLICDWLEASVKALGRPDLYIRIETRSGKIVELPPRVGP